MALKITEDLMLEKFSGYLSKDETEIYPIYAIKLNWFITLLSKYYFIALTNKRILILRVSSLLNEKDFMEIRPEEIKSCSMKKAPLGKAIEIRLKDGSVLKAKANNKVLGLSNQSENIERLYNFFQKINNSNL